LNGWAESSAAADFFDVFIHSWQTQFLETPGAVTLPFAERDAGGAWAEYDFTVSHQELYFGPGAKREALTDFLMTWILLGEEIPARSFSPEN
jgi:hypothetical protein